MTFPCEAATVWSDDFDDGDYEGWTVTVGSFSLEENTLEAGKGDAHLIYHPSSVATGTWSFDILSGIDGAIAFFMCSDAAIDQRYDYIQYDQYCGLVFQRDRGIHLWSRREGETDPIMGCDSEISGWRHIDVTRNSDGRICVYEEGNLVIDTEVDRTYVETSQFFVFWNSGEEAAIDNVVVSNTVDIEPPPPPTPFYMQTWFLAAVGIVVVAIVVIVAYLKLRK